MSKRSYLWSGATLAMWVLLVSLMVSNRSAEPRYSKDTTTSRMAGAAIWRVNQTNSPTNP
jgi:hypothetical protein